MERYEGTGAGLSQDPLSGESSPMTSTSNSPSEIKSRKKRRRSSAGLANLSPKVLNKSIEDVGAVDKRAGKTRTPPRSPPTSKLEGRETCSSPRVTHKEVPTAKSTVSSPSFPTMTAPPLHSSASADAATRRKRTKSPPDLKVNVPTSGCDVSLQLSPPPNLPAAHMESVHPYRSRANSFSPTPTIGSYCRSPLGLENTTVDLKEGQENDEDDEEKDAETSNGSVTPLRRTGSLSTPTSQNLLAEKGKKRVNRSRSNNPKSGSKTFCRESIERAKKDLRKERGIDSSGTPRLPGTRKEQAIAGGDEDVEEGVKTRSRANSSTTNSSSTYQGYGAVLVSPVSVGSSGSTHHSSYLASSAHPTPAGSLSSPDGSVAATSNSSSSSVRQHRHGQVEERRGSRGSQIVSPHGQSLERHLLPSPTSLSPSSPESPLSGSN